MTIRKEIQKHLASAITHGYNDAQENNDGLGEVCKLEAQQNLNNAMESIKQWALEMVGDDLGYSNENEDNTHYWEEQNEKIREGNFVRQEIRARIEESII